MRDALPGKEPQYMTNLDLVCNSFEWHVLAQWLACKAQKIVAPGSSHDKNGFFSVFADSKLATASDRCMGKETSLCNSDICSTLHQGPLVLHVLPRIQFSVCDRVMLKARQGTRRGTDCATITTLA